MKSKHKECVNAVWDRILRCIALTSEQKAKAELSKIKKAVVGLIHRSFKNYQDGLRQIYLEKGGRNDNRRYVIPSKSIDEASRRQLVTYWESPNFEKISGNNKRVVAQQNMHRSTGSRSYAHSQHLFAKKHNREEDLLEIYIIVYTRKGGWVSPEAGRVHDNIVLKIVDLPPLSQLDISARNEVVIGEHTSPNGCAKLKHLRTNDVDGENIVCREQLYTEVELKLRAEYEARERELVAKLENDKKSVEVSTKERFDAEVNAFLQARTAEVNNSFQQCWVYGPNQLPPVNNSLLLESMARYNTCDSRPNPYNAGNLCTSSHHLQTKDNFLFMSQGRRLCHKLTYIVRTRHI